MQVEDPGEEAKPGENCKREVEGEADSCKKAGDAKNEIAKELHKIEDFKELRSSRRIRKTSGSRSWQTLMRDGMTCCQSMHNTQKRGLKGRSAWRTNWHSAREIRIGSASGMSKSGWRLKRCEVE